MSRCNLLLLSDSDRQPRALTKACIVWRFGDRRKDGKKGGRREKSEAIFRHGLNSEC